MRKTAVGGERRIVLRGTTVEVSSCIPDGTLDFCYIDGDHTLRGITVDLFRMHGKVREEGWIGGDDFVPSIWQHSSWYEPIMVFHLTVQIAEGMNVPIAALPWYQFLLQKSSDKGHSFHDVAGQYRQTALPATALAQPRPEALAGESVPLFRRKRREDRSRLEHD